MNDSQDNTMRFTISIVVLNNLESTRKCLEQLGAHTSGDFELIISDNGSIDGTAEFLVDYCNRHANCRIISYRYNTGFGYPHNQALVQARGEYFVVLNNDVFIYESGWLDKLAGCFAENAKLAIVGFEGGYSALDESGCGVKDPAKVEYVEGSCLMIPKKLADSIGLFAEEYELGYWEDVDLSLRCRQVGLDIQLVSCGHEHVTNATSATIDKALFSRVRVRNYKTFIKRWSGYLMRRSFTGRVLVRAVSDSPDNLLAVTRILQRLKDEQAQVAFDLITNRSDIFFCHPAVDRCFLPEKAPDGEGYDRIIDFDFRNLPPDQPVVLTLAEQAAVTVDRLAPVLYLDSSNRSSAHPDVLSGRSYVLLTIPSSDEHFEQIRALVLSAGHEPLSLDVLGDYIGYRLDNGEVADIRVMVETVSLCRLVVGFCGLPLKVAQAIGVPAIALLRKGENPFNLGIDSARTRWVLPDTDFSGQLNDALSEKGIRPEAELAFFQRALLHRVADFNALWSGYRDLKEQEQSLNEMLIKQTTQTEHIANEYEKLEAHFRYKMLEFAQVSSEREQVIADLADRIRALENSQIWRATKPIRRVLDRMSKK